MWKYNKHLNTWTATAQVRPESGVRQQVGEVKGFFEESGTALFETWALTPKGNRTATKNFITLEHAQNYVEQQYHKLKKSTL